MSALDKRETSEVFAGCRFAQSDGVRYEVPDGWYPLLGLPGSLDITENAVLFCRLREPFAASVRKRCLNGVIERLRIHRSARVNGPDSMLVLASDLLHEFEVCRVPIVSGVEAFAQSLSRPASGSNPRSGSSLASAGMPPHGPERTPRRD